MPSLAVLVFAPLIILLAYIIFGIAGFGSTLIAIPLLAHLFPIKFAVPVVVLLDCVGSVGMGIRLRADVNKRDLLPLVPFLLVGMAAGVLLLLRLPGNVLLLFLGVFVLIYGALYVLRREAGVRLPRWSAAPLGLVAGTTSSTLGVGGPLYVMYLTGRGATPEQIRATMPVIFIFTTITRIALFTAAGLFTREVLLTAAALLPLMLLGLYGGSRLRVNLSRDHVVRIIGGLLVLSGISLLLRALQ
jgi:uncharacterized membrane protein YfcA